MIMDSEGKHVSHLDGALVDFEDQAAIQSIFDEGEKRKGVRYTKYFRVDGSFDIQLAVGIIREFFPIEELVDEYFEYKKISD